MKGMQQRDGDHFRRALDGMFGDLPHRGGIEWPDQGLWLDTLRNGDDQVAGDEWVWMVLRQVIECGALLPTKLEQVGGPFRGAQDDACPGALEERVRRHGRPVSDVLHLARRCA